MTIEPDAALLPCPFCGGVAKHAALYGAKAIQCADCAGHVGYFEKRDDAIAAWNRRAGQSHADAGLLAANRLIVDLADGLNALDGRWWELQERLGISESEAVLMSDQIERARAAIAAAKGA